MKNRPAPDLAGAPCQPGQEVFVRFVTEDGVVSGVWLQTNDNPPQSVELPVSHMARDFPVGARGTYTFTVPAVYVSEANDDG